MESFFSRYKNPLVLVLILLAQFVLLAVQVRPRLPGAAAADQAGVHAIRRGVATVVAPPEEAAHAGGLGIRHLWSSYLNLVDVKQQNEALEARNQQLQLEEAALAEDARQGERLQELLAFKQHYLDATVPAQVIGTGGSDHGRVLLLDKGSEDGIAPDMPVITPDGIVGRIRDVNPHSCQVLEISDPTSAAGVLLEETRTRGILKGDSAGNPEIVNLMPDDRIQKGQVVLTSGGDQIFPRGLPVGSVERVVPDTLNQPLVDVILKPAANLSRLEEVLIVTSTSPVLSARAEHDLTKSQNTASALKAAASATAAAAAEAALEAQRASDILAQRLPSANADADPDAPDAAGAGAPATANVAGAPLHPPSALHADHYTPGGVPAADTLTPGARLAPYAQDSAARQRAAKAEAAALAGDTSSLPSPAVSPAFRAAHDAALAARPHPSVLHPATGAASPLSGSANGSANGSGTGSAGHTTGGAHVSSTATPPRSGDYGVVGTPPARSTLVQGRASGSASGPAPANGVAPQAAAAPHSTPRPALRPAPAASGSTPSATQKPRTEGSVPTQVVTDGPLPVPRTAQASGAQPGSGSPAPPAPRHRGPVVVPDDGSRPPAAQPAQPKTQTQTQPQEQR